MNGSRKNLGEWVDGWMDGWMDGSQSRVKDCLQQSKTLAESIRVFRASKARLAG